MKFEYSLKEIYRLLEPDKVVGKEDGRFITGIADLGHAEKEDLSFLGNAKYRHQVAATRAGILLLPLDYDGKIPETAVALFCKNPSRALAILCCDIEQRCPQKEIRGIHPSAVIAPSATIGQNVSIGPCAVIEEGAQIGDYATIMAQAYIGKEVMIGQNTVIKVGAKIMDRCHVGDRCTVFEGAVIGSDGFGYETINGVHEKVPQIGNVVLEDDVDVGANTTIDRARFSSTRIGKGTKIDNLVQIGHNVEIGRGCLLVSQTGIAGSTKVGDYVVAGGQVGIAGHIDIPNRTMFAAKSGVASCKYPEGTVLRGIPAQPIDEMNKIFVLMRKLPDLFKRVKNLEKDRAENKEKNEDI